MPPLQVTSANGPRGRTLPRSDGLAGPIFTFRSLWNNAGLIRSRRRISPNRSGTLSSGPALQGPGPNSDAGCFQNDPRPVIFARHGRPKTGPMKNLRIRQLKAYQAIVSTGSATAAAEMLSLTQPAVSRILASLEADLGFQLFERRGRHLVHSDKGRKFFRMIEATLTGLDALPGIVEDIRLERGSPLRISAIGPLLFSTLVPSALRQFQSVYPDLRLKVNWVDRLDIEDWIVNQNSDIGLTLMPVEHPLLDAHEFVSVNAVALLPEGHALTGKSIIGPSDFRDERLIIPNRRTRLRQLADKCMLEAKHPLPIAIETSTAIASCHLVAAGMGVGISDPFSATGIRQGRFVVRPWQPTIRMSYAAIWLKSRTLAERSATLIEILRNIAGTLRPP